MNTFELSFKIQKCTVFMKLKLKSACLIFWFFINYTRSDQALSHIIKYNIREGTDY